MVLDLTYYDDPLLRKKCNPIKEVNQEIKSLIKEMIETMESKNGAGLAAPQIGQDLRLFVIQKYKEGSDDFQLEGIQVFINPKLSNPSDETEIMSEGCLSLPGLHLEIERPLEITVEALDANGKSFKETFKGFRARQVMHENDHINGKLFFDRIHPNLRKKIEPILRQIKKKYSK
jgi:peptide deformylase